MGSGRGRRRPFAASEQTSRKEKNGFEKRENGFESDPDQPEGNGNQPHKRKSNNRQQRQRPAKNKENAPKQKIEEQLHSSLCKHGRLVKSRKESKERADG
jgi:hypothetical protein